MKRGVKDLLAVGAGVVAALPFVIIFIALDRGRSGQPSDTAPVGAIAQAEVAFVGGHTQAQIKERLDEALTLYDVPTREENYSRASSALIFRQPGPPDPLNAGYLLVASADQHLPQRDALRPARIDAESRSIPSRLQTNLSAASGLFAKQSPATSEESFLH